MPDRDHRIKHASGEFIAFLDADDVWEPCALEEQVAILQRETEAAMTFGPVLRWHSWADGDETPDVVIRPWPDYDAIVDPPGLLEFVINSKFGVPLGALMRRTSVVEIDGYVEEFRGMFEDRAFFSKFLLNYSAFISDRVWYRYRQHPDSCVSKAIRSGQRLSARRKFLKWLLVYLRKNRCWGSRAWRTAFAEYWLCRYRLAKKQWNA